MNEINPDPLPCGWCGACSHDEPCESRRSAAPMESSTPSDGVSRDSSEQPTCGCDHPSALDRECDCGCHDPTLVEDCTGRCNPRMAKITERELAALRAERDHYFAKMESVNLQRQRNEVRAIEAEAERDAMRPVVEAAGAVVAEDSPGYTKTERERIAIDRLLMEWAAFRAAQQEATE